MEKFTIFSSEELGKVRTLVDTNGDVWFLGTDVAECLQYARPRDAVLDHTDEEDRKALKYKVRAVLAQSEQEDLWGKNDFKDKIFINESALYQMIFESEKPSAKEFKKWVTKTVLPSIRMHGGYIYNQESLPEDEKNALYSKIEKLTRDTGAYKDDSDLWMQMYFKLEKDYLAAMAVLSSLRNSVDEVSEEEERVSFDEEFEVTECPGKIFFSTPDGLIMERNEYVESDRNR